MSNLTASRRLLSPLLLAPFFLACSSTDTNNMSNSGTDCVIYWGNGGDTGGASSSCEGHFYNSGCSYSSGSSSTSTSTTSSSGGEAICHCAIDYVQVGTCPLEGGGQYGFHCCFKDRGYPFN